MARFVENTPAENRFGKSQGRRAEAAVRSVLTDLPDDYTILLNVDITGGAKSKRSELDVCVVTPRGGLVVIEVKDGDVERAEDGTLTKAYETEEASISGQMASQQHLITKRLESLPSFVPFAYLLVLPYGRIAGAGFALTPEYIFEGDRLGELCSYITEWSNLHYSKVGHDVLCDFIQSRYTIVRNWSSARGAVFENIRENAQGLADWVPRISSSLPLFVINAPAGAGKTMLAARLIEKASQEGRKAVYLNFSRNIVERFAKGEIASRGAFVGTWHELALEAAGFPSIEDVPPESRGEFFDELSRGLCERLAGVEPDGEPWRRWDVIIVDDAQNFEAEWIEALGAALNPENPDSHLYLLCDPEARLFDGRGCFDFGDCVRIDTDESARITFSAAVFINGFGLSHRPVKSRNPLPAQADQMPVSVYHGPSELLKLTRAAVEKANLAGFDDEDIAVLSWKGLASSEVLKGGCIGKKMLMKPTGAFTPAGDAVWTEGTLLADTVRRFQGLSAPCVILTEVDFEAMDDRVRRLLYLGLTRASARIELVVSAQAMAALNAAAG